MKTGASVSTDGEVQRQLRLIERYLGIYETPEDDLNSLKDNQMPGTCEWFTEKESFQHWSSFAFNSSRIFWLNGNPGAGKSVLASFIVHYLRNLGRDCSYYFFKHGDGDRASLSNCLSSLAYQMALLNPQVRKEILIMHDNDVRLDTDNARALWRTLFLSGIFKSNYFRPQFLILDALDECNDLADLFPMLAKIQAQVPLRILITSRKTFELSKLFSPLGLQLSTEEITPLDSLDDIKHYVKAHRQHLLFTSNDDYENIERQILHKSSGCFLWVKLILNELEQAWSEEEGREILNEVPTDMDEIYYRILDNLSKISRGKRFVKAALTWIVCANRPLTVPELEHALKLDTNDSIHSLERLLTSACGQLIQIDRNSRVQMIHQTARDYLLKDNLQSEFAINKSISHGRLAEVCLKYLVSRDMERPRSLKQISVTRHHPRSLFADYACTSFSDHLGQAHPGEERFVDLLELHFNSNVLAWVEYIASTGDLYRLPQAVKNLKSYLSRCLKCNPSLNLRVQSLEQWTTDLIRVSTKFGKVILTLPNAIYDLIPPFCPSESMIFKSSGARSHGLLITGLQSTTWDDCLACIDHHGDQTTAIACSEKLFAIGLSSGRTVLYHKSSCHKHVALEHPETVNLLEFGTLTDVVASSGKKTIIVWSTTTGANLWTLQPSHEPLTLTFSENDTLLSAATKQNFFTTWDLRQESELRTLPWHDSYENEETAMRQVPTNAAVCPEKRLLAIVYRGRPITLWDLFTNSFFGFCGRGSSGRPAAVRCPIEAMVFNPNPRANILVAAYADGDIAIFDPWQCEVKQLIEADAQTLACSPDGRTLAAGNSFGTVQIFDFGDSRRASLTLLYQIDAHGFCVKALAFSQDSLQFMALHGSQCRIWEPSALVRKDKSEDLGDTSSVQAQTVYIDTRVSREITAIACHPLDNIVFCGKDDGTVSVYHTSNGKQISQLYIHTKGLAVTKLIWGSKEDILVSTDLSSRFMVRKIQQKGLKCWEASEPVIDTHTQHAINQVILSPDNNYVLISTELADFLWDIEGRLVRSLTSQLRSTWRWANHPADSQRLIYFSPVSTCIRNWSNLEVLETLDGSLDRISLGAQEVIQTVLPCCNGKKLVVELWLHKWSHFASRLLILNTPSAQDGEPSLSSFGDMSAAVAYPIGILGNELFFLDREMFVCSVDIEASDSCYFRHFFIPYDWFDSTSRPLCHITSGKDIVFGKRGELAVIKGGFSSKERVPLS